MFGLINYIRHDLEGIYTAELLRGSISMLVASILLLLGPNTPASAYTLIIALYGLRSLTPNTFGKRILELLRSLALLIITLIVTLKLGQFRLYIPELLLATSLSTWTVYLLFKKSNFSGTMMFMSVFAIVNFGMGLTANAQDITTLEILSASLLGAACVLLAAITVPVVNFHWCLLINHCFHHDLKKLCHCILEAPNYGSQYELPLRTRDQLLKLESSLFNIISHVRSPTRQQLYQDLIGGLVIIIFWPAAHTDNRHLKTVNTLRRQALQEILHLVCDHQGHNETSSIQAFSHRTNEHDPFCNGELSRHITQVIKDASKLAQWESAHPEDPEKKNLLNQVQNSKEETTYDK